MKKSFYLSAALILALTLTACGSSSKSHTDSEAVSTEAEENAASIEREEIEEMEVADATDDPFAPKDRTTEVRPEAAKTPVKSVPDVSTPATEAPGAATEEAAATQEAAVPQEAAQEAANPAEVKAPKKTEVDMQQAMKSLGF